LRHPGISLGDGLNVSKRIQLVNRAKLNRI